MTATGIDFGYPWWLSYGHLVVLLPALAALAVGWARRWPVGRMILIGLVAAWAAAACVVVRRIDVNGVATMPTENFLRSGEGRIVDLGAGTGRSAIMVLKARPKAKLVAVDLFAASFQQHFHGEGSPQEKIERNLRAAGVAERASVVTGDMRKLPLDDGSFDAAVSAYAMDHLGRQGGATALREAFRVLKPGGDLLLILVANDGWARFAYGPLLSHGTRGAGWWRQQAAEAGFQVVEEGAAPITMFFVLRRPVV